MSEATLEEGEAQIRVGRVLAVLQDVASFVQRSYEVVQHIMLQLASMYTKDQQKVIDVSHVHFVTVLEHLGGLLTSLITLDEIISGADVLQDHWKRYKRYVIWIQERCDQVLKCNFLCAITYSLFGHSISQIIS